MQVITDMINCEEMNTVDEMIVVQSNFHNQQRTEIMFFGFKSLYSYHTNTSDVAVFRVKRKRINEINETPDSPESFAERVLGNLFKTSS